MSRQWLRGSVLKGVAGGLLAVAVATPAAAGTLYRWKAADGSIAYADDLKRIPERYREKAEVVTTDGLGNYQRYTPTDTTASREYAEKLAARLDSLRAWNAATDVAAPRAEETAPRTPFSEPSAVRGLALQSMQNRVGRRQVLGSDGKYHWVLTQRAQIMDRPAPVLGFHGDPESDAPVVVEQKRMIDSFGVTQHVTIVRQGDKVLNVIAPHPLASSSDWPRLSDYDR